MPYIKPEDRLHILADEKQISTAGELNYFISTLINWYLNEKVRVILPSMKLLAY